MSVNVPTVSDGGIAASGVTFHEPNSSMPSCCTPVCSNCFSAPHGLARKSTFMKHTIRKTAAVAAIVAASALALPAAAQADTIYPPSNACNVVPTVVTPGATVTFNCTNGTFTPGEFVSVRVTGNTSARVGMIKFAVTSTGGTTASGTGSISVPVTFPSNASGTYNFEAFSETSAGGASSASISTTGSGAGSASD